MYVVYHKNIVLSIQVKLWSVILLFNYLYFLHDPGLQATVMSRTQGSIQAARLRDDGPPGLQADIGLHLSLLRAIQASLTDQVCMMLYLFREGHAGLQVNMRPHWPVS